MTRRGGTPAFPGGRRPTRSRRGRRPRSPNAWIPACAGMTRRGGTPVLPGGRGPTMSGREQRPRSRNAWIPACAGMTRRGGTPVLPGGRGPTRSGRGRRPRSPNAWIPACAGMTGRDERWRARLVLTGRELEPRAASAGKPRVLHSERAYGPTFCATGRFCFAVSSAGPPSPCGLGLLCPQKSLPPSWPPVISTPPGELIRVPRRTKNGPGRVSGGLAIPERNG